MIPGATEFLHHLQREDIPYLFLTNNLAYAPLDVAVDLRKFDILTSVQRARTSAGFMSIAVLASSTSLETLKDSPFTPTRVVSSIAGLLSGESLEYQAAMAYQAS
ncbi:MAG: hypothetical protein NTY38_17565 [Acidobacteria bacterium]|nr:hypothetical protein [Acidobacteriota bacterium]